MNKIVLILEAEDLLDLQQILLDDDEAGALDFLTTRIAPKIPARGVADCDSSRRNPYLLKTDKIPQ